MFNPIPEVSLELKPDLKQEHNDSPEPISIMNAFESVRCFNGRTPETTDGEIQGATALLSTYRNGGVYITHYCGFSEWEQHSQGDEFVQVMKGETHLILLLDGIEQRHLLTCGHMMVVPQSVWHRFESPKGVKVMTITPQPTEHSISHPNNKEKSDGTR
ncbi:cupin domain-containing protein [uncultured Shewanella sp.]|uniref:cupin domain-containing protein n=1 Tax=uncultured Shewanella sp. TaxID=173975 RepID=UPI0026064264|nr:cupin domain-containing protein [uncultured Shewanella sp.]